MPTKFLFPAVLLALATLALPASAQTHSPITEPPTSDWYIRAYTSLWAGTFTGTAGHPQTEVDVDANFGEIFDNGTWGLEFNFEAGPGPWYIILDGLWMHLGDDPTTSRGGLGADFDGDFGFIDIAGAYELRRFNIRGKQAALDGLLGFRWTSVSTNIHIEEGPVAGRITRDTDKDFVDPYLGLRSRFYFSDKYNLTTTATVGGVGVGSNLFASGEIMFEYRFDDAWSLLAGYRAYYYDYDDNFEWNVVMHGPVIGLAVRF
jgi:hypothetical protein